MNIKKNKNKKKGFVILIALVVSSLLLSIGIFIQNVAYKELLLSNSNKNTQIAFSAADTAIECALYQEFQKIPFREDENDNEYAEIVPCNGSENIKIKSVTADEDSAISIFEGSLMKTELAGDEECKNHSECKNEPYVKIRVEKKNMNTENESVEIQVWAHNMYKNSSSSVERSLKVKW